MEPIAKNLETQAEEAALKLANEAVNRLCENEGYRHGKLIGTDSFACVMPLMFTAAIITGKLTEMSVGYSNRWCYHSIAAATAALDAWNGTGEPEGWHRHPNTGRRRDDGKTENEYINY